MTVRQIYLAGPDVFLPDAIAIGERKKALCARYGFRGLFPFDNEVGEPAPGERIDRAIYRENVAMIRRADAVIVNLTPFRGPSADVGSVFELGLAAGLGKVVCGYTNVASDLRHRIADASRDARGAWRDPDGLAVEDFGNADNLMIDGCLAAAGYPLVRVDVGSGELLRDLRGFETCLKQLAQRQAESLRSVAAGAAVA